MTRTRIAHHARTVALSLLAITLAMTALALAPQSDAQPVAGLRTTPPPTPTPGFSMASCQLGLTASSDLIVVGDDVTFDVAIDCACGSGNVPPGSRCGFLLYELNAVDSAGLFAPLSLPVGPPGPRSVTLTATAPGSGEVTLRWYGELVSPLAGGDVFYQWTYLSASIAVEVEADLPSPVAVNLVNANVRDAYVPHAATTRPPSFLSVERGGEATEIPAGTQAAAFVPSAQAEYVVDLILGPGEEIDELTCVRSVATERHFLDEELRNIVQISGVVTDGQANTCTFTTTQGMFGDVNCDQGLTILDAAIIAQFTVGLRENESCPTSAGAGNITLVTADTNDDQVVNVLDAFRVAQCSVSTPNSLCPIDDE